MLVSVCLGLVWVESLYVHCTELCTVAVRSFRSQSYGDDIYTTQHKTTHSKAKASFIADQTIHPQTRRPAAEPNQLHSQLASFRYVVVGSVQSPSRCQTLKSTLESHPHHNYSFGAIHAKGRESVHVLQRKPKREFIHYESRRASETETRCFSTTTSIPCTRTFYLAIARTHSHVLLDIRAKSVERETTSCE